VERGRNGSGKTRGGGEVGACAAVFASGVPRGLTRIEPQSGEWMDHGETGRVARAVRTGRVARDRADRTG
jgi:hypothetical protein